MSDKMPVSGFSEFINELHISEQFTPTSISTAFINMRKSSPLVKDKNAIS